MMNDLVALNGDEGGFACENCDIENITIDVPGDVSIDNLVIGDVRQRVPDGKEPVRIANEARIRRLDGQPAIQATLDGAPDGVG